MQFLSFRTNAKESTARNLVLSKQLSGRRQWAGSLGTDPGNSADTVALHGEHHARPGPMPGAGSEHPAKRAEETMPIYLPEVIGRPRVPCQPSHRPRPPFQCLRG